MNSLFSRLRPRTERSLRMLHPCLTEHNPVLVSSERGFMDRDGVAWAIGQYYFLVLAIVELLTIAMDRLADWDKMPSELLRNIGEENGSRTNGIPHRDILKRCLKRLGLKRLGKHIAPVTSTFLNCFKSALLTKSQPFVAGMIYALESSANPELEILAKILNAFGRLADLGCIVDESAWNTDQLNAIRAKHARDYSPTEFIYVHLVDFEKGHKSGLWKALSSRDWTEAECIEFMRGFEFCLDLMDQWWIGLAQGC